MSGDQLLRGDCGQILPTPPPDSVQAIVTSPPYNTGMRYGDDGSGDRLPLGEYKALLAGALAGCYRVLRPGGVLGLNIPPSIAVRDGTGALAHRAYPLGAMVAADPAEFPSAATAPPTEPAAVERDSVPVAEPAGPPAAPEGGKLFPDGDTLPVFADPEVVAEAAAVLEDLAGLTTILLGLTERRRGLPRYIEANSILTLVEAAARLAGALDAAREGRS